MQQNNYENENISDVMIELLNNEASNWDGDRIYGLFEVSQNVSVFSKKVKAKQKQFWKLKTLLMTSFVKLVRLFPGLKAFEVRVKSTLKSINNTAPQYDVVNVP